MWTISARQPPVHRHRDGADLARAEEQLEELQRVLAEIAGALAGPTPAALSAPATWFERRSSSANVSRRSPAVSAGESGRSPLRSGERGDRSNRVGSSRTTIHGPLIVAVCAADGKE